MLVFHIERYGKPRLSQSIETMTDPKKSTLSRRQFLSALVATGMSPRLLASLAKNKTHETYVSAQGNKETTYGLSWYSNQANKVETSLSGFRGHAALQHPLRPFAILMFGRRPATTAIEVNLQSNTIEKSFQCAKNRHLFGHGCFSQDGKTLFTTEAEISTGNAKIAIRDTETYQQIGEFDSYGIGSHEIKLMPDGNTLVVANGGIHTHPDSGRKKLNLDSMDSSLVYIDAKTGKKLAGFKVDEEKASIRHIDVATDGTVALAMQVQRAAAGHEKTVALGAVHKPGNAIQLLKKPEPLIHLMNDYMGSVAINNKHRLAGFTSPRGNIVAFWNIDTLELAGYHQLHDVCGIAVSGNQNQFIISNAFGQLRKIAASTLKEDKSERIQLKNTQWDNHLIAVKY